MIAKFSAVLVPLVQHLQMDPPHLHEGQACQNFGGDLLAKFLYGDKISRVVGPFSNPKLSPLAFCPGPVPPPRTDVSPSNDAQFVHSLCVRPTKALVDKNLYDPSLIKSII